MAALDIFLFFWSRQKRNECVRLIIRVMKNDFNRETEKTIKSQPYLATHDATLHA